MLKTKYLLNESLHCPNWQFVEELRLTTVKFAITWNRSQGI